ncbi:MAG: hypothetical protein CL608_34355 [Anaerolineaceae bacterium]|jgi:hypothetical protein|nr:hypothetical protein [Anaerolineaceae bacterium]
MTSYSRKEVDGIRAKFVEEWRELCRQYGGLGEDGMPLHPDQLPKAQAEELKGQMLYWNKEYARLSNEEDRKVEG